MYKILYETNRAIIQKNNSPAGFIPLWENYVIAYSMIDIPDYIFLALSENDKSSLEWFFLDLLVGEMK